eukprot:806002-Amorphochlora_amoeboformis.AAC.1
MGCGVSSVPPKAKRNEKGENKSLTNQIKTKLVQNTEDYGPIPLGYRHIPRIYREGNWFTVDMEVIQHSRLAFCLQTFLFL